MECNFRELELLKKYSFRYELGMCRSSHVRYKTHRLPILVRRQVSVAPWKALEVHYKSIFQSLTPRIPDDCGIHQDTT